MPAHTSIRRSRMLRALSFQSSAGFWANRGRRKGYVWRSRENLASSSSMETRCPNFFRKASLSGGKPRSAKSRICRSVLARSSMRFGACMYGRQRVTRTGCRGVTSARQKRPSLRPSIRVSQGPMRSSRALMADRNPPRNPQPATGQTQKQNRKTRHGNLRHRQWMRH